MNRGKKVKFLVQGAVIGALYVVLTFVSSMLGLSSGVIQLRLSEALCILPVFTPAAVVGLFVGCILANTLTNCIVVDIIFGSLATLIGAIFTRYFRKNRILAIFMPILSNTLIVPFVLKYAYLLEGSVLFFGATIFLGEVLSCGVLGLALGKGLEKHKKLF